MKLKITDESYNILKTAIRSFSTILFVVMPLLNLYAQNGKVNFTDVTEQAGIDFRYTFGDFTYENILESSGSGITIFDYNNDELPDLYMLNGTYLEGISDPDGKVFKNTRNKLYKNNGDGTFSEVAHKAGVDDPNWSMAAGVIDIDNDGDEDLYLLNYGPNIFFRNNGDGTFSDITQSLELEGPTLLNGFTKWSVGVAFWDFNSDDRIDAMVGNFLAFDPNYISPTTPEMMPHPSEYKGQATMLYQQLPNGKFKDVTKENGLFFPDSKCMGITIFDYDNDDDLDIFQGNDHQLNFLFRNDNQKYTDVAIASGVAANSHGVPTGSMHGSIGDIDGDGLIDLLVTDLRYGAMYRNIGNGLFEDITEKSGIASAFAGKGAWGAAFFDYDNDGDLDIFSANGTAEELILQHPVLLENDGNGRFKDIGQEKSNYFSTKRSARAAAVWDYDNDGDLDIIVSHIDLQATATLLRNDGGNSNHWLGLKLIGKNGPASAIGAKVIVKIGDKKQVYVNQNATSYLSYNDPRVHIGLGNNNKIDQIEIHWSNGKKEIYENPQIDRYLTIKEEIGILKKE
ncbi:MAG: CRTAC1 family protein [Prolixibacteraceae bacterium]|jgi:enediyne biosynthesis protein E4|nr:CRTAC1 family protein [Prolixibacteraceae bacterium]MBT6764898.1 CRTAC1 family protein [Prolixibacteraceae bacterium]MBT6996998.1 CRTAC1 family protein [Prolixibacteraceae bacterium]MBT7397086.1 CRTAC1 family protein [Prolixibacteraceae bacterium]